MIKLYYSNKLDQFNYDLKKEVFSIHTRIVAMAKFNE